MVNKDNALWTFAEATAHVDADFVYFDENKDGEDDREFSQNINNVRAMLMLFIKASGNNQKKLSVLMQLFAGFSLRECGERVGMSHEYCRIQLESIKEEYPLLYHSIKEQNYIIENIAPELKLTKWTLIDTVTEKNKNFNSLLLYCKKDTTKYWGLYNSCRKNTLYQNRFKIIKNW